MLAKYALLVLRRGLVHQGSEPGRRREVAPRQERLGGVEVGDGCDGESSYDARPVSYALRSTALDGDVYVLESTLEDHGSEDPFSATRFIALTVNADADLMMIDIDGEAGRAPLTEMPADPQSAWGWFADDPESRGVMAVWQGEGPG